MNRGGVFDDTLVRYFESSAEHAGFWLIASAAVMALALPPVIARKRRVPTWLVALTTVVIAVLAALHAWHLRWIGDDAFISFRYAKNLVEGHGLVFNLGARVEGYTNFLWTLMLAGAIAVGLHPGQVSIVLSIASLVATCVLAALLVRRLLPRETTWAGSIAALLLAGNYTFASYGTSGIETMFAALLVLLAVERASVGAYLVSGALGIAATLAHPDHAIFYAMLGLILLIRAKPVPFVKRVLGEPKLLGTEAPKWARGASHNLLGYGLPFVFVFIPYFVWRTSYYGDLFPNTYYAKSASGWYASQGFVYLGISTISGGIWATLPFALWGLWLNRRSLLMQFTYVAVPVYLLYVIKIGGDFMLGRLLCPVLPPVFIAAELGVMALLGSLSVRQRVLGLVAVPMLALAAVPALVVKFKEKYQHVADERTFYLLESFSPLVVDSNYTEHAAALNKAFAKAFRPPVVGLGSVGIVGYETGMPMFDYWGLTEPNVARMKLKERGRPGHEKLATLGHAVLGGADFVNVVTFRDPYAKHTKLEFYGLTQYLVKYDADLLAPLEQDGTIKVPDFEAYLSRWRPARSRKRLACDVSFMSYFYFLANQPERAKRRGGRALSMLSKKLPTGFVDWVVFGTSPTEAGYAEVSRQSFDELPNGWKRSPNAFDTPVSLESLPGQRKVVGNLGAFINSFHPELGDKAVGELESPKFLIKGDVISIRVGGGFNKARLNAKLMVGKRELGALTGCDSELMARWAWDVSKHRGKEARLVIQDHSPESWGHILVDELVQYERT